MLSLGVKRLTILYKERLSCRSDELSISLAAKVLVYSPAQQQQPANKIRLFTEPPLALEILLKFSIF